MLKVLDTIRKANSESISDRYQEMLKDLEYECVSCGTFHKHDEIEERIVTYQGEREVVLVCPRCIKLGWEEWNRG